MRGTYRTVGRLTAGGPGSSHILPLPRSHRTTVATQSTSDSMVAASSRIRGRASCLGSDCTTLRAPLRRGAEVVAAVAGIDLDIMEVSDGPDRKRTDLPRRRQGAPSAYLPRLGC